MTESNLRIIWNPPCILASQSTIRRELLERAGMDVQVMPAHIDEELIRDSLIADDRDPASIAEVLAETKARQVAARLPTEIQDSRPVIGSDQILSYKGKIFGKPKDEYQCRQRLIDWLGEEHQLHTATVAVVGSTRVFGKVGFVRLRMRTLSTADIDEYLARCSRIGEDIHATVGGYRLEGLGIGLFATIIGDWHTALGLNLQATIQFLYGYSKL